MPIEMIGNQRARGDKNAGVRELSIDAVPIRAAKRIVNKFSETCRGFDKEWGNRRTPRPAMRRKARGVRLLRLTRWRAGSETDVAGHSAPGIPGTEVPRLLGQFLLEAKGVSGPI